MLRALHIRNYALIESATLTFQPGLTAITGETGSGKSILLGAFSLLLGDRADHRAIRDASAKCIAEAQFEIRATDFAEFFRDNDLDFDPLTSVRREITPGGKSRAFINDTPVSLQTLKSLGERLVDVHSQHENSILADRSFRFSVLDAFAAHGDVVSAYTTAFQDYRSSLSQLEKAREDAYRLRQNLDYIRFQLNELDEANLDETDQQELEQERDTLTHAETIRTALWGVGEILDGEGGVNALMQQVKQSLGKISTLHPRLSDFMQRAESMSIESRELASEMNHFAQAVESNEERMAAVQDILDTLYRLQQKHRAKDVETLMSLREELRNQSVHADHSEEQIALIESRLALLREQLESLSGKLAINRKSAAEEATSMVTRFLAELQLGSAVLEWRLSETTEFNAFGKSDVELLFRANKGGSLQPIQQVASGGEISRVMLALKASIAHRTKLPVLILDEIDQGVSGEVALRIGDILREVSRDLQVITITHLPQIAGKADHHFKVSKQELTEETRTSVSSLVGDARVSELAEMLGGKKHTPASVEHARELLLRN